MPADIHTDLITETKKLEGDGEWMYLMRVKLDDTTEVAVCRSTEDITYPTSGGITYHATSMAVDGFATSTEDESKTATIQIHDVTQDLKSLIHTYKGFTDKTVEITIVHKDHLDIAPDAGGFVRRELWEVSEPVEVRRGTATWQLGFVEQYERPTPHNRFSRTRCGNRYGWFVCQFPEKLFSDADIYLAGLEPTLVRICDHGLATKNGCLKHKEYAVALGVDDSLWPKVMRIYRGIRPPRN